MYILKIYLFQTKINEKCVFVVPNDLKFGKTHDLKSPELNYLVEIKPNLFPSLSKTKLIVW